MEVSELKGYRCKINKNVFMHGYGFYELLHALLWSSFCLCIAIFLISCATLPHETYLNKQSLSGISKVAIIISVNPPEVSYSMSSPDGGFVSAWTMLINPLLVFPSMGIEAAARYGVDQEHALKIKEHVDLNSIEDKMAQSFIQPLKNGICFQTIEYFKDKNQNVKQLSNAGYNAVIQLSVNEISIQRTVGDYVDLFVNVSGQMKKLMSGEIVWNRKEIVKNPEPHTLDYYKENGLKELDAMLERAGTKLSYDFIYLK
jgi:hypothetical protein